MSVISREANISYILVEELMELSVGQVRELAAVDARDEGVEHAGAVGEERDDPTVAGDGGIDLGAREIREPLDPRVGPATPPGRVLRRHGNCFEASHQFCGALPTIDRPL